MKNQTTETRTTEKTPGRERKTDKEKENFRRKISNAAIGNQLH